jgi:diguanylate cyclase (GGDEF)-like protein
MSGTRASHEGGSQQFPLPSSESVVSARHSLNSHKRGLFAILGFGAALIVLLWAFALERISYERAHAIQNVVAINDNLVGALEEHVLRTVQGIDQLTLYLKYQYERRGVDSIDIRLLNTNHTGLNAVYTSFGIADEHGRGVFASPEVPFNVTDREYFPDHRDNPQLALRIGTPLTSKLTGLEVLHFTRRIDKANGSFGGVVVMAANPAYFTDFYHHINVGRDGIILLAGLDGIVRARRANGENSSGRDISSRNLFVQLKVAPKGHYVSRGFIDGTSRYVSYRSVSGYPLVVAVGTSTEESLASFAERKRNYLMGSAVATLLIGLFTAGLVYFWARQRRVRKLSEARLHYQAHYDELTDLPNRALLYDRLSQCISHARRKGFSVGVLFIDLDGFKPVNDTLGHPVGDALLRQVAERLRGCVRDQDTVARLGGDEFVIILAELTEAQDGGVVARKISGVVAEPFDVRGHEIFVTASIGISTFPGAGENAQALISNADAAMLKAKEAGRNAFKFYTAEMNERAMEQLLMERDLRRALDRKEFLLHYQPKLDLKTGLVSGLEALIRWHRPDVGLIPPVQFIPILENTGLIVPVGEWVIVAACVQLREWIDDGVRVVPVAVNLSAKQFLHHDICQSIQRGLLLHGIPPQLLEIEITETAALKDVQKAAAILRELRSLGLKIAIDDFGTGYSSLGYLKNLPVDALKLDRSFVSGLPEDQESIAIARAVIGVAHSMDLRVVAEGVETLAQRNFLAYHGCHEIQGYLLSRPLAASDCRAFLDQRSAISILPAAA